MLLFSLNDDILNGKGLAYEKFVLDKLYDIYDIKEGYLWKNVPNNILMETGILYENDGKKIKPRYKEKNSKYNILLDTGIDIICKLEDDTILLVQCKAYSSKISQKHLSGFYRTILDSVLLNGNEKKIVGLIVHTSSLSDIITTSYSYSSKIIQDIYIPFDGYTDNKKKRSIINIYINFNHISFKVNFYMFWFIFITYTIVSNKLYNK